MVMMATDRAWTAAGVAPALAVTVAAVLGQPGCGATATSHGGKRGGRQRGGRATGGQTATVTLCNFHGKFGDAAKKCVPNCSRWNEERPREAARVFHVEEALDGEDTAVGTASENS